MKTRFQNAGKKALTLFGPLVGLFYVILLPSIGIVTAILVIGRRVMLAIHKTPSTYLPSAKS